MPTEMELRVSRALDARIEGWFSDRVEANLNTIDLARAAIRAMREPTEAMLEAEVRLIGHNSAAYEAMIDAASPELERVPIVGTIGEKGA
jgi:hypothetical protein